MDGLSTLKVSHRPEGWMINFTVGEYSVTVGFYPTEGEAINALNQALGFDGMMRYRVNGGNIEDQPKEKK